MALLNPYIGFRGTAEEAMNFYQSVFGGELSLTRFGEFEMPGISPDDADLIMHAQLTTSAGFTLMGADAPASVPADEGSRIDISISGTDAEGLRAYWDGLTEGGNVTLPLEMAPWGDWFGQVTDRFGVSWMVSISPADGAGQS